MVTVCYLKSSGIGASDLFWLQPFRERHAHGAVGNVAQNSAVERAHRVGMLRSGR